MRKIIGTIALAAAAMAMVLPAHAATKSKKLICAASEAQECTPNGDCRRVPPGAINLPPMWDVDLESKKVSAVTMEGPGRSEDIEGVQDGEQRVLLHGVQGDQAWSAVISRETGAFTTTISAGDNGFVVFGVCAPR